MEGKYYSSWGERVGVGLLGIGMGLVLSYLIIKTFPNSPYLDIIDGIGIFLALIGSILVLYYRKYRMKYPNLSGK